MHSEQNKLRGAACGVQKESAMCTEYRRPKEPRNSRMKAMNPLNKFSKPTRCEICLSIFHW